MNDILFELAPEPGDRLETEDENVLWDAACIVAAMGEEPTGTSFTQENAFKRALKYGVGNWEYIKKALVVLEALRKKKAAI